MQRISASTASSRPSASKAPRTMWRWSRLWKEAVRFSRRSSIQASAPPNCRAAQTRKTYSGHQRHLLAEAAADIGCDDAKRRARACRGNRRCRCGACAASGSSRSASPGRCAGRRRRGRRAPRAAWRSAGASGRRSRPPPRRRRSPRRSPWSRSCPRPGHCRRRGHGRGGAPGASAASRSTTASSGSMSTKTCSAMSSASSRDAAITAATGWPTKVTASAARIGCVDRHVVGPVEERPDAGDAGKVGGGEHRRALRPLDAEDAAAGDRAPDEGDGAGAGRGIGGEPAVAGEQRAVLAPRQRACRPRSCGHRPFERTPRHHRDQLGLVLGVAWISPNGSKAARAASAAARKTASPGASPTSSVLGARSRAPACRPRRRARCRASRMTPVLDPDRGHRRDDGKIAGAAVELDEAAAPAVVEARQADLGDHLAVAEVGGEDRLEAVGRRRCVRLPPALRTTISASSATRQRAPFGRRVGMGDGCRRRCRACGSADARCCGRSSGRSRASGPSVTGCSKTTWRVSAPIASVSPSLARRPASPAMRLMSMSTAGRARRKFIAGTRLWPPASTRPSPPCSARSASRLLERARREIFEGRGFHDVEPSASLSVLQTNSVRLKHGHGRRRLIHSARALRPPWFQMRWLRAEFVGDEVAGLERVGLAVELDGELAVEHDAVFEALVVDRDRRAAGVGRRTG